MDPRQLPGSLKAAILIQSIGEELSEKVLGFLSYREREVIESHLSQMGVISPDLAEKVAEEFSMMARKQGVGRLPDTVAPGKNSPKGGHEKDRDKKVETLKALQALDADTLAELIKDEHPQTIAVIVVHLSPEKASDILSSLPEDLRMEVLLRISNLDRVSPDVISEVAEMLESEAKLRGNGGDRLGGIKTVADILNQLDHATESALIGKIEEMDPKMADQIRQLMFIFEDLASIDDRGMQ